MLGGLVVEVKATVLEISKKKLTLFGTLFIARYIVKLVIGEKGRNVILCKILYFVLRRNCCKHPEVGEEEEEVHGKREDGEEQELVLLVGH